METLAVDHPLVAHKLTTLRDWNLIDGITVTVTVDNRTVEVWA